MTRVAESLSIIWNTVSSEVFNEEQQVLISDSARFENLSMIRVDEHFCRHAQHGDEYVTVIIELAPMREQHGLARLLDMVQSRSKQVYKSWLKDCTTA